MIADTGDYPAVMAALTTALKEQWDRDGWCIVPGSDPIRSARCRTTCHPHCVGSVHPCADRGAGDARAPRRRGSGWSTTSAAWPTPSPADRIAAPRQGAQVHRTRQAPGGGGPLRVHLRHRARDGREWHEQGLGHDLLLANEVAGRHPAGGTRPSGRSHHRRRRLRGHHRHVAARAGLSRGADRRERRPPPLRLSRPEDAGRLADRARAAGLTVRGVMGYEGHIVGLEDRSARAAMLEERHGHT
jgi:hypothetical protein